MASRTAREGRREGEGEPGPRWFVLPRRVLAFFLAADALAVLVYAAVVALGVSKYSPLYQMFDVNQEMNVPSWYSASQLLLVGIVLLVLASPLLRDHPGVARLRRFWLVLGCGFVYLSADEGGVIHERLSQMIVGGSRTREVATGGIASILKAVGLKGTFRGGGVWLLMYALVALVILAALLPQIGRALRVWPRQSVLFVAGVGLMFAGGIVLEGIADVLRLTGVAHLLEVGLEELLEMFGVTLALTGAVSVFASAAAAASLGTRTLPSPAMVEPEQEPAEQVSAG